MNCRSAALAQRKGPHELSLRGALAQREGRRLARVCCRAAALLRPLGAGASPAARRVGRGRGARAAVVVRPQLLGRVRVAGRRDARRRFVPAECRLLRPRSARCPLLARLGGGVLFVGDSMSRQHYTAFSCARARRARVRRTTGRTTTASRRPRPDASGRARGVGVFAKARVLWRPSRPRASPATRAGRAPPPSSRGTCRRPCCRTASRGSRAAARTGCSQGSRRAAGATVVNGGLHEHAPAGYPRVAARAAGVGARARPAAARRRAAGCSGARRRRSTRGRALRPGRLARQPLALRRSTAARATRRTSAPTARSGTRRATTAGGARRTWAPLVLPIFGARCGARAPAAAGEFRKRARATRERASSLRRARSAANHDEHMALRDSERSRRRGATRTARTSACRRRRCGTGTTSCTPRSSRSAT